MDVFMADVMPLPFLLLVLLTGTRGAFRDGITDSAWRARARCVIRLGRRRPNHVSSPIKPFSLHVETAELIYLAHGTDSASITRLVHDL